MKKIESKILKFWVLLDTYLKKQIITPFSVSYYGSDLFHLRLYRLIHCLAKISDLTSFLTSHIIDKRPIETQLLFKILRNAYIVSMGAYLSAEINDYSFWLKTKKSSNVAGFGNTQGLPIPGERYSSGDMEGIVS